MLGCYKEIICSKKEQTLGWANNVILRLWLSKTTLDSFANASPLRPAASHGMLSVCELFQHIRQKPSSKARKPVLHSQVTPTCHSMTAEADNDLGWTAAQKRTCKGTVLPAAGWSEAFISHPGSYVRARKTPACTSWDPKVWGLCYHVTSSILQQTVVREETPGEKLLRFTWIKISSEKLGGSSLIESDR